MGKLIVHAVEMIGGAGTGRHLALYCMATYNSLVVGFPYGVKKIKSNTLGNI